MSQRIFNIILGMDLKNIETQLALQCAPVITGLKPANLLIIDNYSVMGLQTIMEETSLSCYQLLKTEQKTIFFLYNARLLRTYLAGARIMDFLRKLGYKNMDLENILALFQLRYKAYKSGSQPFPHEMGLLLGYPLEDVEGFIKNEGRNSLYTGCWKVYSNLPEKVKLFAAYERAKETLLYQIANGISMLDIMKTYRYQLQSAAI